MFGPSIQSRLYELGTRRHGPGDYRATERTIDVILKNVWCRETARPDLASSWNEERPSFGQDDVTTFYLVQHVYGGQIALYRLPTGRSHHLIWRPNGEGASNEDFCPPGERLDSVRGSFTTEQFLEHVRCSCPEADPTFQGRLAIFTERFEATLAELEHEADEP